MTLQRAESAASPAEGLYPIRPDWAQWESGRQDEVRSTTQALDWLQEALKTLPEALRETTDLVHDGDLTQAQIAEILNISPGAISWRMSEVKKLLRRSTLAEDSA